MKKHTCKVLIVCLIILALVFAFLWQTEKSNRDDLRLLAQASAKDAHSQFKEYQEMGHESSYWYGVAAFRSFEQAYYLLTEGTNKNINYTFFNQVYGALVLSPDKCQSHVAELVAATAVIANDIEDDNGFIRMSELYNLLKYE